MGTRTDIPTVYIHCKNLTEDCLAGCCPDTCTPHVRITPLSVHHQQRGRATQQCARCRSWPWGHAQIFQVCTSTTEICRNPAQLVVAQIPAPRTCASRPCQCTTDSAAKPPRSALSVGAGRGDTHRLPMCVHPLQKPDGSVLSWLLSRDLHHARAHHALVSAPPIARPRHPTVRSA